MEYSTDISARLRHSGTPQSLEQLSQFQSEMRIQFHKTGQTQLERYPERIPEAYRAAWMPELILHDVMLREAVGQSVGMDEYRQLFPEHPEWVQRATELLESEDLKSRSGGGSNVPECVLTEPESEGIDAGWPLQMGRYRIERKLGEGGFGRVYLATDTELNTRVALKIPRHDKWAGMRSPSEFLREAARMEQISGQQQIPGVVRCLSTFEYDGLPVIVMDYVEGQDLGQRLQMCGGRLPIDECIGLLRKLCAIMQRIHQVNWIHRDLKPRNVLLDREGNPWLTDFGFACLESERLRLRSPSAGTLRYMAPEQINEEITKLGPHTDVWGFGVMMYEMLSGQLPFKGSGSDLRRLILAGVPWSLRSRDGSIPERLAEICHKCLRNSLQDRYRDMAAIAADLDAWFEEVQAQQIQIVQRPALPRPRGLQAYDEQDRYTFPALLSGEMEPDGLPGSLHYWLTRLEIVPVHGRNSRDGGLQPWASVPGETGTSRFSVGVIHGGSGCGKTSFVKAGLLPLLPPEVHRIYLEATPDETELELLKLLHRNYPGICEEESEPLSLPQAFRQLREGKGLPAGGRLLIVLDQFEQWLHGHATEAGSQLAMALRHCEGGRLQVLLLVREEYWSALQEFIMQLDIRLDTHWNDQCLQWFSKAHATTVLIYFGKSLGKLPLAVANWSSGQMAFIESAVEALGHRQGGRVVPVQLAIFAELFRDLEWSEAELERQGGTAGIGTRFLMQIFSGGDAREGDRRHRDAAMRLLEELLPAEGQNIRGHRRPESQLRQICGYSGDSVAYQQLIELLERRLKLIARRDPVRKTWHGAEESSFMLTHDFLVPSIRAWVEVELGRTASGRALSLLRKRNRTYADRWESRQLPSLMEWIFIRLFTSRSRWTVPQRQMMTVAAQKHLVRLGTIGSILLLAVALTFRVIAHRDAQSSVDKLTRAGAEDLTEVFPEIDSQQVYVAPLLRNVILDAREEGSETGGENSRGKALLHARLALVGWEASHVDWLVEQLLEHSDLEYVEPLRSRLHPFAARVAPRLLSVLRDSQESASRRFRAVLGLVGLPQEFWRDELQSADLEFVAGHLTSMFAETQPLLRRLLEPIRTSLLPSLEILFDADHVSAGMQINAAMALHEYAGDNPQLLTRLVTRATAAQMAILFPENDEKKTNLEWDDLVAVLQKQPRENFRQKERVRLGLRRANAAIAMLRLGDRHEYFDVFRVANDPEALSQFVARCRECGVTVEDLLESLESACAKRVAEMGSASRDSAHRIYGLLLALGNYSLESISDARRAAVLEMLEGFYEQDPAAVVHSASGWLLRHWGHATVVERLEQVEVPYDPTGKRDWFRMRLALRPHAQEPTETPKPKQVHSLTFVVFQPGEYRLGSPDFEGGEEERDKAEVPRIVRITRPFAICDRELTFALFDLFDGGVWRSRTSNEHGWDLTGDSPACGISWLVAVEFCRWLTSEYYGEDEALQSHASNIPITDPAQGQRLLYIKPGDMHLDRRGFRMATESEWEVAARGGQSTAYAFGGDAGLLADYGWYWGNSQKRPQATAKKRPSISGLYDTHGNLYEWTFDGRESPQQPMPTVLIDYTGIQDSGSRILRSGSWSYSEDRCRSAYRDDDDPNSNGTSFGFRLVLTPSALPIPSPQP